jgi:hypothetical protein
VKRKKDSLEGSRQILKLIFILYFPLCRPGFAGNIELLPEVFSHKRETGEKSGLGQFQPKEQIKDREMIRLHFSYLQSLMTKS